VVGFEGHPGGPIALLPQRFRSLPEEHPPEAAGARAGSPGARLPGGDHARLPFDPALQERLFPGRAALRPFQIRSRATCP